MNGLKVLISPLSWGFGHAGRMIPLARALQRRGCEVVFAADADLLRMTGNELPGITMVEIPGLKIRYSRFLPQYTCIFLQLPRLVASALRDHRVLRRLATEIRPAVIISDNRFGFWHKEIYSVYITHQVRIAFPVFLGWLEPVAEWVHRIIINRYNLCLVPDYPGETNLSGRLSHGGRIPDNVFYLGPLSRFAETLADNAGETGKDSVESSDDQAGVAQQPVSTGCDRPGDSIPLPGKYACLILSGPEPQRSILPEKVSAALGMIPLAVLTATPVKFHCGPEVQLITAPSTATMHRVISGASLVVARAGYTSVMELASLRRGAVLIPTPGQTEQEYLGRHLDGQYGFVTMKQDRLEKLGEMACVSHNADHKALPDPDPLLEKVITLLLENNKE